MRYAYYHLIFTNKAFSPCNNKYESLHNIWGTSNIRFFHINNIYFGSRHKPPSWANVQYHLIVGNPSIIWQKRSEASSIPEKVKRDLVLICKGHACQYFLIRPGTIPLKVEGIPEYHDLASTPQTQHIQKSCHTWVPCSICTTFLFILSYLTITQDRIILVRP